MQLFFSLRKWSINSWLKCCWKKTRVNVICLGWYLQNRYKVIGTEPTKNLLSSWIAVRTAKYVSIKNGQGLSSKFVIFLFKLVLHISKLKLPSRILSSRNLLSSFWTWKLRLPDKRISKSTIYWPHNESSQY